MKCIIIYTIRVVRCIADIFFGRESYNLLCCQVRNCKLGQGWTDSAFPACNLGWDCYLQFCVEIAQLASAMLKGPSMEHPLINC